MEHPRRVPGRVAGRLREDGGAGAAADASQSAVLVRAGPPRSVQPVSRPRRRVRVPQHAARARLLSSCFRWAAASSTASRTSSTSTTRTRRKPFDYMEPLQIAVQRWWRSRQAVDERSPPRLDAEFDGDAIHITDTRDAAPRALRHADGPAGARACARRRRRRPPRRSCGIRTSPGASRTRARRSTSLVADRLDCLRGRPVREPARLPQPSRSTCAPSLMPISPLRKPLLPTHFSVWCDPPDEAGDEILHVVSERRSIKLKGRAFREFTKARRAAARRAPHARRDPGGDGRRLPSGGSRRVPGVPARAGRAGRRRGRRRAIPRAERRAHGAAAEPAARAGARASTCRTRLAKATVAIVGLGGAGAATALSLGAAGIGTVRCVDWLPIAETDVYFTPALGLDGVGRRTRGRRRRG